MGSLALSVNGEGTIVPEWLNEPGEWAAMVTIVGGVMAALLWIIRREIMVQKREFRPNGGNSMRDVINRIEANQKDMKADIREIRATQGEQADRLFNSLGKVHGRIDDHIASDHLHRRSTDV